MATVLVVISHYNAWPADQLIALLDQIEDIPAGHPFQVRVVVNQAEPKRLQLPSRHAGVEICYRENTGYNIGAWDFGWRQPPEFDDYLFLQEECRIRRKGWLKPFLNVLARPGVGLVGESLASQGWGWEQVSRDPNSAWNWPIWTGEGDQPKDWTIGTRAFLKSHGIEPGETMEHLQSLVLAGSRPVLEAIQGFRIGGNHDEAIACEVGISKSVEAIGKTIEQVSLRPFEYIVHPQWLNVRRKTDGLVGGLRCVVRHCRRKYGIF